jgi:hypothetical protein
MGKPLSEWVKVIAAAPVTKRNDLVKWLKEKNGFGHMNASLLAGIYLNHGKPVYGSTEDLDLHDPPLIANAFKRDRNEGKPPGKNLSK